MILGAPSYYNSRQNEAIEAIRWMRPEMSRAARRPPGGGLLRLSLRQPPCCGTAGATTNY
jgi:hypothetical protein